MLIMLDFIIYLDDASFVDETEAVNDAVSNQNRRIPSLF